MSPIDKLHPVALQQWHHFEISDDLVHWPIGATRQLAYDHLGARILQDLNNRTQKTKIC